MLNITVYQHESDKRDIGNILNKKALKMFDKGAKTTLEACEMACKELHGFEYIRGNYDGVHNNVTIAVGG